jgi:hypothetical protein
MITLLVSIFIVGVLYQPNWIYQTFYYNTRWVDDYWWSLSYLPYLIIYSFILAWFAELLTGLVKKYTQAKFFRENF